MEAIIQAFLSAVQLIQHHMLTVLSMLACLWGIQIINSAIGYRLNILGNYPRSWHGILGIFISPFLHGNYTHLFFNTIPFFILSTFVMINGIPNFIMVTVVIIVLSGSAVWLFGRKAIHIGASGVIMGYLGYLLMNIFTQGTVVAVGIGAVCLYYFTSMLFDIFPSDVKTSWEGHLFGLISGVAASYIAPFLLITYYHP